MAKRSAARSAFLITLMSIVSKGLGLFRVLSIGWEFGQGIETDAYNSAININGIAMNIIGAAIMTVMVPVLAHVKHRHGNRGKLKFYNNVSNIILVIAILLMVLTYLFAPNIVSFMYSGFEGDQLALTIRLVKIGVPIILALGLMNVSIGYLQSYNIYGPYAMMGIPFNIIYLVYLFFGPTNIRGLMLASVIAYFSQWLIQLPSIYETGYRWQPLIDLEDRYLHRTLRLIVPTAVGQAVQQLNVIVDQKLASGLAQGTVSALDNAAKLNDAVVAVFITGLTTVIFPLLSEAFEEDQKDRIVRIIYEGLSFVFLITVPATFGMMLLSEDIVTFLFQRNNFTAQDTAITASTLVAYSAGILANGMRHLITKVYYSINDTKTPMINGMIAVGINIILNIILVRPLGHFGLALATSISISIATFYMLVRLRVHLQEINYREIFIEFAKILVSALVMAVAVYISNTYLTGIGFSRPIKLLFVIGLAVVVYSIMVILTRTYSGQAFLDMIKRKAS